ncbi:alkaline phosphatase family protein [Paenibacillus filicis]|uniref:Alkaline phosphatase family protein n=1 Tax=Paenibacillus gyeongsangnamensis TaxID=3388067 RepID=A0ABT4QID0_9BACL|nr:alkaline phosphatase family protein [Paenibacillus filicis]MCZ8516646.1 alkaline phosphatase family protein [Paenibacillus filicis]
MKKNLRVFVPLTMACSLFASSATCFAADAAPVSKSKIQHVLLISVDGLHQLDLDNFVKNNPNSTLASLSQHGITYNHAVGTKPSDSFPGLLALVTGGTPNSTGVFYDDSYDRRLLPPVASKSGDKPGTEIVYDESIDKDSNAIDGGGKIDPDVLPRDPVTKQPVYPHQFLRVNTVFEALKAAGKYTAWSDKHLAYDLVNGPSGKGVDDLYTPEIAANGDATKSIQTTKDYDDLKVTAILNEIDGKNHAGTAAASVPALFGMNFQAVSVAQKLPGNGYKDASGTVSAGLADALDHTDKSLGKMISELKKMNLFDSTEIIITAKHGQSPIDPAKTKIVDKKLIIDGVSDDLIAQMTTDDVALIWLTDSSKTDSVVAAIAKNKDKASIKDIYSYNISGPKWPFNNPATDSRVPDIVIQPNDGVIYTKPGKKIAEHGGFSDDDNQVALLVSYAGIGQARHIDDPVTTTQVAPTIMKLLGVEPGNLQAIKQEHTQPLPEAMAASSGFKFKKDGNEVDSSNLVSVSMISGHTVLSADELAKLLGASIDWADANTLTLTMNGTKVQFTADSNEAFVNGIAKTLDVGASNKDGVTLLPLRFVAELFGKKVGWSWADGIRVITID